MPSSFHSLHTTLAPLAFNFPRHCLIRYSALDAKATYDLAAALEARLRNMPCLSGNPHLGMDPAVARATGVDRPGGQGYSMWDLYRDYWQPFGLLLTDMERQGMMVDRCGGFHTMRPRSASCMALLSRRCAHACSAHEACFKVAEGPWVCIEVLNKTGIQRSGVTPEAHACC